MTRIGWCPGDRTVADMLARYPSTRTVRIFVGPGKPLPAWDGPVLGPIPAEALVHLSFKTWDLPAVERWLSAMPDRGPLILTYAHEPEQGVDVGDPTVEQFRTRWAELVAALADHPRRADVLLVPVYTRYWWQKFAGDLRWLVPMVDAYGWDVYNDGKTYRTPDDLLTIPRDIARRTGLPYLIGELGAVRLAGDGDGVGRSAWMRAMVAAARADGALTVCWFHRGECDLTGPASAGEQQTWRELTQEVDVGAQRRLAWINRGSPFRLMTPLAQLRDRLRGYGYTVYDIGNRSHLEHDPPEDHTPYSATGYPGEADYGVGYAIDVMPPPAGSGLPSLQQLGAQLLADRKAGGARWLKYMNWEPEQDNGGDCWHESWEPTYTRRASSDRGHIHLSGLTGYETSTIAADYDPVARIRGEDDMPTIEEIQRAVELGIHAAMTKAASRVDPYGRQVGDAIAKLQAPIVSAVARESSSPDEVRAALAAQEPLDVDALAAALAPKLVTSLPADSPITDSQLERVLRTVLGSVDNLAS